MNKPNPEQMEALRVRLAKLCGYEPAIIGMQPKNDPFPRGWRKEGREYSRLPSFTEDLNAIHEATSRCLKSMDWMEQFSKHLFQIVDGERFPESVPDNWFAVFDTLNAEAWQRCVALDRTLSEAPIL